MNTQSETIQIEVAYGLAHKQKLLSLYVNLGTTVAQAITESGMLTLFPEILCQFNKDSIFFNASD